MKVQQPLYPTKIQFRDGMIGASLMEDKFLVGKGQERCGRGRGVAPALHAEGPMVLSQVQSPQ